MKKVILILITALLAISAYSQIENTPHKDVTKKVSDIYIGIEF